MTTLAEHIIIAGAQNRPPMIEKSMYDSWASHIRIFIKGKKNGRMKLDSINNAKIPQLDSGLTVPTFQQGEDSIDCINKAIEFLSAVASRNKGIATTLRGNYAASQVKIVKCYNYLGEGHMAKQYTQPKRLRNSTWFKDKLMLVEAQEASQILDEEQLAFIADPGIAEVQVAQQTIP
ncbi:hypothetical protein Tco_1204942 [Tanacetum coccineum]